jgi:hypothetical protein
VQPGAGGVEFLGIADSFWATQGHSPPSPTGGPVARTPGCRSTAPKGGEGAWDQGRSRRRSDPFHLGRRRSSGPSALPVRMAVLLSGPDGAPRPAEGRQRITRQPQARMMIVEGTTSGPPTRRSSRRVLRPPAWAPSSRECAREHRLHVGRKHGMKVWELASRRRIRRACRSPRTSHGGGVALELFLDLDPASVPIPVAKGHSRPSANRRACRAGPAASPHSRTSRAVHAPRTREGGAVQARPTRGAAHPRQKSAQLAFGPKIVGEGS